MIDHNPPWAAPERVIVPKHLQVATPSSSFARPPEYTSRKSLSSPSGTSSAKSTRSGFATRPRAKVRGSTAHGEFEDMLPPTESIRGSSFTDADVTTNLGDSTFRTSTSKASLKGQHNAQQYEPIIIFGFPPGSTSEVLQFFSQFGEIIERTNASAAASVECGRNWLRITYKSAEAAERALAQNGRIMPGQYVVGCVRGDASMDVMSTKSQPEKGASDLFEQSSTNFLLLDDEDVSFLEEQSGSQRGSTQKGTQKGTQTESKQDDSQKSRPSSSASSGYSRIVPKTMPSQMLRDLKHKQEKPLKDQISTSDPFEKPPQNLVGKVAYSVANILFGWDN